MDFAHRRQEQAVVLGYALLVATVVLCARAGLFPGTGEALPFPNHPYRLSMAAAGGLLAVLLGTATGWIGVRRDKRLVGFAALAAGGFATGAALSFSPMVLYPNDQYPVSFGWVMGGAPLAVGSWLIVTLVMNRPDGTGGGAVAGTVLPRLLFFWTKSIAAGAYLVPLVLIPSGTLSARDALWHTATPLAAATFLVLAAGFLVWETGSVQHPTGNVPRASSTGRLPLRRKWRAGAGAVFGAYGVALILPFVTETGPEPPPPGLVLIAGVLAMTTALLGGAVQAGNDRRTRLLLPVRLLAEALIAGAGTTVLLARLVDGPNHPAAPATLLFLALVTAGYILFEAVELLLSAPARAGQAPWRVPPSRRRWFHLAMAGATAGVAAPWLGWPAAPVALLGVLARQVAHTAKFSRAGSSPLPSRVR